MKIIDKIKDKTKNTLPYYIFALLVTIMILILWQTFREKKSYAPINQNDQPKVNVSAPKTDLNQKIFFASNGRDTAYKIKKGDKWSVIFNGIESKEYDSVSGAIFSADGEQFAFAAENNGNAYVVVNNVQEIIAYQRVGYIVFNSTGTNIAFVSYKGSAGYVIISTEVASSQTQPQTVIGEETESFDQIGTAIDEDGNLVSIIFSDDGDEFIYIIEKDGGVCVVTNGVEGEVYDSISDVTVDSDGNVSYTAEDGNQTVEIVNNEVVSETETENSTTSNESTTSTTTSSTSTSSSTSETSNLSGFKPLTTIDIDRSTDSETDTEASCAAGQTCNF